MEEDDESVTTQSSNSADNEESNITSTTEDILDSLPENPCDPTACTPLPDMSFVKLSPLEKEIVALHNMSATMEMM